MAQKYKMEINDIRTKLREHEIHIIPYCHADFAWTHSRQWHIERYILIINEVLDVMNNNPDYTWMLDNYQHILEPFLEQCPSRIDEFKQKVRENRIEITNGVFALVRPAQIGEETFIRNIAIGKKRFKELLPDIDIDTYHNVDVGIGHSQLPQMLVLGGYSYYRAWRPQGAMDYNGIPRQFIWKGLDGTKITSSRGFYGGFENTIYMDKDFEKDWDDIMREFYQRELSNNIVSSCGRNVWISQGMDDTRPLRDLNDRKSNVLEFVKELNNKEQCKVHYSTAGEYYKKTSSQDLPIVDGILDACGLGFNIPTKGEKGLSLIRQRLERKIIKAETLFALASLVDDKYPKDEITELWTTLLGFSGHAIEFVFKKDYQDVYNLALKLLYDAQELIDQAKNVIVDNIKGKNNKQYVIFNTTNWEREECIPLNIPFANGGVKLQLTDPSGKGIENQILDVICGDVRYLDTSYDEVEILAKVKIPPLGYSTVNVLVDDQCNDNIIETQVENVEFMIRNGYSQIIDTGKIKVEFSEGKISAIWDKGENIVKEANHMIGDFMFTKVKSKPNMSWLTTSAFESIEHFIPTDWEWEEYGPLRWKYVVRGYLGSNTVEQKIILHKNSRCIDFEVEILNTEVTNGFFSVKFPSGIEPKIVTDIPFGIEHRKIEKETYGILTDTFLDNLERMIDGVFVGRSWVSSHINSKRYSLISEESSYYYLYDKYNPSVSIILMRIIDYKNQENWMRKLHTWMDCRGMHTFKYSFYLHDGNEDGQEYYKVIKLSKEKSYKLEAQLKTDLMGFKNIPQKYKMLDMEGSSAIISAFYKDEDKYILRLYEAKGEKTTIKFKLSDVKLVPHSIVDFNGNLLNDYKFTLEDEGTVVSTQLMPWQIINIKLKIKS